MRLEWKSIGREHLILDLIVDQGQIKDVSMQAIGSLHFLRLSQHMKALLMAKTKISELTEPEGKTPPQLIWQEVLRKLKAHWQDPIPHEELCHCRKVATRKVDEAIVYGAHNLGEIRKQTSANTGCGTCLGDIEKLLKNRL